MVREELLLKTRELFTSKKQEIGHPKIAVAVQFFVAMYVSVITEHVMTKAFPAETLDTQQIGQELYDACARYLQLQD